MLLAAWLVIRTPGGLAVCGRKGYRRQYPLVSAHRSKEKAVSVMLALRAKESTDARVQGDKPARSWSAV